MSVKRQFTLKSGLLGLAMALAAGTAQAEISDGAIRIGYLVDMSGPYRDLAGPGGLEALQMAVEDHGSSIHGAPIEIFSADDRNSADVGASIVREWIDQRNIDMVAGLVASSVTIAVTRLIAEHDRIALSSGSAALGITNEHCSPNHIQWVYDTHAMSNGTARAIVEEGGKRWFILSADYAFGHSLEEEVSNVVTEMGGEVVGTVRHPLNNQDFSSFILQAQGSGAQIVGVANAGADTVNAISTAGQFGLVESGQTLAGLMVFLNDIHALGLETTQGMQLTTGWYWDMNDEAREWAQRFYERMGRMPTMVQAGVYSSTMHYLNAIEATGSDDAGTVRAWMGENPVNDIYTTNGVIREDGRMVYDMYLVEVKSPEDSEGEWDLYRVLRTIPGEQAFQSLEKSRCPLINP
ncbi:ABC transporter permease [Billgrantia desiderata SP1]|jgi:branched-chain amino acid transport system substrate-binding protein|uniref:ABC transporter substrate-binding protein n=1 Tax=Halomonadaceae TaxID=28256 RepID=UPI000A3C90A9|nr:MULTISPECIES: ABC transporter substrate-binding protein [Halomonas]AXY43817.1 ABC transporter substrate-binding protein [Halomonas sp. JS92-SW72]OUE37032.1 ABC transporter permease [Halomonas desiderata SP1]QJQ97921.1 ABC transporter substrate-binding protein [Halomonas sp. PGE1]